MIDYNLVNKLIQCNISTAAIHEKTFSQFKTCNRGKDVVIVATGPTAIDYVPKDAIHISLNRAFELPILFDYAFIQDFSGRTPEYIDALDEYRKNKCIKFYGLTAEWDNNPNRVIPESHAIKANALRYRTDWMPFSGYESRFAYDIANQALGCFGSIVFPALQFALWTYPKRIYLVGCDCTNSGYWNDKEYKNTLFTDQVIMAYRQFKFFAKKYYPDVKIISINPVGLKGIFEDRF